MKTASIILIASSLLAGYSSERERGPVKGDPDLKGSWLVVQAVWGQEPIPPEVLQKSKLLKWTFSDNGFQAFVGADKDTYEEGTYQVGADKSPKHLDLIPKKGEILTTRKCVYVVSGDELKIAFSINFAPGTAEEELERAKKARATRPRSLRPGPEHSVMVLTFKRQKA